MEEISRYVADNCTLLKILVGLYQVKEGNCEVAGKRAPEGIRRQVAMVMQTPGLFPLSIRDNITCGHPIPEEKVWEALRAAQLEEWVRELPDRLDSLVGERGGNLSGGQAQRIAIARAIAKDAPVVLLDEPTSALDGETADALLRAMERLVSSKEAEKLRELTEEERAWLLVKLVCVENVQVQSMINEAIWL